VTWLNTLEAKLWSGRISAQRVEDAILADEEHHWRDTRGQVHLIPFYRPGRVLQEILELGEYF
jgi:hypothetical protein